MKRLLAIIFISLFVLATPGLLLAESPAQKLKNPVINFTDNNLVVEEIVNQGSLAEPDLIGLLNEKVAAANADEAGRQWGAKVTAMNILSELKSQNALAILKDILENTDNVSGIYNSARTIGNIGGDTAFKILEQVFINAGNLRYTANNEERKKAVIAAMGLCDNKKAVPYLLSELNNPNNDEVTQIYAAGSLGLLGVNTGLGVASAGLNSKDDYVRMAAVRAVGVIGSPSSIPALNGMQTPTTAYVYRKNAKVAIFQIETAQLPDEQKVGYIQKQLMTNPKTTEFVQWGTFKLKKLNIPAAKKALEQMSVLDGEEFAALKQAAKIRFKTMK